MEFLQGREASFQSAAADSAFVFTETTTVFANETLGTSAIDDAIDVSMNETGIPSPAAAAMQDITITLFHIGKTGGTTLTSNVLRIGCKSKAGPRKKKRCWEQQFQLPESQLSRRTKMFFHYGGGFPKSAGRTKLLPADVTEGQLYTVREPLARFESAYYYHSPFHCASSTSSTTQFCKGNQNLFRNPEPNSDFRAFYESFPSLQHLADALRPESSNQTQIANTTQVLLQRTFRQYGLTKGYGHMTAGYRYYTAAALKWPPTTRSIHHDKKNDNKVFVVRTEKLWEDVETIDVLLGGKGDFSTLATKKISHGSENQVNRTFIDDDHDNNNAGNDSHHNPAQLLCCALFPEMQAYRVIVDSA
ncbi:MAG: hypothetical protein SGILL_005574, partial [Bacillariaceae sp.]